MYREKTLEQRIEQLESYFENATNTGEQVEDLRKEMNKRIKKQDSLWRKFIVLLMTPLERLVNVDMLSAGITLGVAGFCAGIWMFMQTPSCGEEQRLQREQKIEHMVAACQSMDMEFVSNDYYDGDDIACAGPSGVVHIDLRTPANTVFVPNPAYHE